MVCGECEGGGGETVVYDDPTFGPGRERWRKCAACDGTGAVESGEPEPAPTALGAEVPMEGAGYAALLAGAPARCGADLRTCNCGVLDCGASCDLPVGHDAGPDATPCAAKETT